MLGVPPLQLEASWSEAGLGVTWDVGDGGGGVVLSDTFNCLAGFPGLEL